MTEHERKWATEDLIRTLTHGLHVRPADLRAVIAAHGFHVVTAAEKAVLDAIGAMPESGVRWYCSKDFASEEDPIAAVFRAELARREAAK